MGDHRRRRSDLTPRTERVLRVLGLLALICIAGGSFYVSDRARQAASEAGEAEGDLRKASLGACERVNFLRENDNRVAVTLYETLTIAARLVNGNRPLTRRFNRLAMTVKYIPKTRCAQAIGTPAQYRPPAAVSVHVLTRQERERLRKTGFVK